MPPSLRGSTGPELCSALSQPGQSMPLHPAVPASGVPAQLSVLRPDRHQAPAEQPPARGLQGSPHCPWVHHLHDHLPSCVPVYKSTWVHRPKLLLRIPWPTEVAAICGDSASLSVDWEVAVGKIWQNESHLLQFHSLTHHHRLTARPLHQHSCLMRGVWLCTQDCSSVPLTPWWPESAVMCWGLLGGFKAQPVWRTTNTAPGGGGC